MPDGVVDVGAAAAVGDQPRLPEFRQVLRQIRLPQPEAVLEVAHAGLAFLHQRLDDLQANGVSECLENLSAVQGRICRGGLHIRF
jgi:hypothetical protein